MVAINRGFRTTARQLGLTLIEVLTVVAILSILAMVSTPLYQGYQLRVKVGTGAATIAPVQRLATEYFMLNGSWPADNNEAGANAPDSYSINYLTSVAVTESPVPGSIVLTYDASQLRVLGSNNTLIYYPDVAANNGAITWKCDKGTIDDRYRPTNCLM